MTLADILLLSAIVAAFTSFAVLLAWAEHQTRDLGQNVVLVTVPDDIDGMIAAKFVPPARTNGGGDIAVSLCRREAARSRFAIVGEEAERAGR